MTENFNLNEKINFVYNKYYDGKKKGNSDPLALSEFKSLNLDKTLINHDNPYFTCIQSSVSDAGRNAALMIIDIIKNPDVKIKRKLMKGVLKVGHSTGKPQTSF